MTGTNPDSTEQPLRILMTADAVGGVWRYSLDLIQGLVNQGAEVLLATMGPRPSEDQKRQAATIAHVTLAESDYALEWMPNPWRQVDAAGDWLLNLAETFRADLIHLNGYVHAALPWRRPVVVVAHSCVFSWWRAVHYCAPDQDWDEYRSRLKDGLAAADIVVAPSAAMARSIVSEYGVPQANMRVIYNFSTADTQQLPPKSPFFLAAGRVWDEAKNIGMLEKISPRLNWEIRVSGNYNRPEDLLAPERPVRFLGLLPYTELLEQMRCASIFAHPSFYEPFGLSVLEAALRRCCLVLADIPSLRELWEHAAVFVDPCDPDRWVYELNSLTGDAQRREELAERAQLQALRYNAQTAIGEYWKAYQSLLSSCPRPGTEAAA